MIKTINELRDQITKDFAEKGKILAGGWSAFENTILRNASEVQKVEMRKAFYLGAQHVWATLLVAIDPGDDASAHDMKIMEGLRKEFDDFGKELAGHIDAERLAKAKN